MLPGDQAVSQQGEDYQVEEIDVEDLGKTKISAREVERTLQMQEWQYSWLLLHAATYDRFLYY
jgi:hypothetical protein